MVKWDYLDWTEMVDTAEDFFKKKLSPGKKVVLVHHGDADGVTSGVFISRVVEKLTETPLEHVIWVSTKSYQMKQEKVLIDTIAPDVLIVTDLDLGKEKGLLHHWSATIEDVFIYDHHNIGDDYRDTIPRSIEYLNARMLGFDNIWHPASFFGYALHRRFFKEDYPWMAAIGLRGDHAYFSEEYDELQENVKERFPKLLEPIEGKEYKNHLEKCTYYINSGFFHSPDLHESTSYRVLQEAVKRNDPYYIYSQEGISSDLKRKREELKSGIEKIYLSASEKAEFYPDKNLIIYKIETPHYILGVIASKLIKDHDDKVVLILNQFGNEISGEIRRGDHVTYNLVRILLDLKERDFKYSSVGGHPAAAGCLFEASLEKEFRRLFLEIMDEQL